VPLTKRLGFDWLAIVVFGADFSVKGAVLAPYRSVWDFTNFFRYHRITYGRARGLEGACDITEAVRRATGV